MVNSSSHGAFEYRQPFPVGEFSLLNRSSFLKIVENFRNSSAVGSECYFIHGPKYCGKSSLANTILTELNLKQAKNLITIKLTFDDPLASFSNATRQLIDQVIQNLLNQGVLTTGSALYLDWRNRVDGIDTNASSNIGLRSAIIIANCRKDISNEELLNSSVFVSDLNLLYDLIRRNKREFRKFVFFIDDMEKFREKPVEKLINTLLKTGLVDVCLTTSTKYKEYWDTYMLEQTYLLHEYGIKPPRKIDLFVLFFREMDRSKIPDKHKSEVDLWDIYQTADGDLKNFLIICHLIWQQVKGGLAATFEINTAVLNGLISIAKRDSVPNTIQTIESAINVGKQEGITRQDMLEVLTYKSLSTKEIAKIRNLPNILNIEALDRQITSYERAKTIWVKKELIMDNIQSKGHIGLADAVAESYVRFHLRDELRREKGARRPFLANNSYDRQIGSLLVKYFFDNIDPHAKFQDSIKLENDKEIPWPLLEFVKKGDIFSVYEEDDSGLSNEAFIPNCKYGTLRFTLNVNKSKVTYLCTLIWDPNESTGSLDEMFSSWCAENKELIEYTEGTLEDISTATLEIDQTKDLEALVYSQDTSEGMRAFSKQHYFDARDEFSKRYDRMQELLAKYRKQFDERVKERTKLVNKMADLRMRFAFTNLLVGNVEQSLQTFLSIRIEDLEDDHTVWLYYDDLANCFAFSQNWQQAFELIEKSFDWIQTNLGGLHNFGSPTLLQFLPDGLFGLNMGENEISRYRYEKEEDPQGQIPILFRNFLSCKLNIITPAEFLETVSANLLDSNIVPSCAQLRSALWFVDDTVGEEGVRFVLDAIRKYRISKDSVSKKLYDDIDRIKGAFS